MRQNWLIVAIALGALLWIATRKVSKMVSLEEWAGQTDADHQRRLQIASSYGIEYRSPTFYNPSTGESMPVDMMADYPGWTGAGYGGSFETEVAWINNQILKGTPTVRKS